MYSDVDHSRIKTVLKPIFSVFLIFALYFNIFATAHAGAAEQWTIEKVVYNDIGKTLSYTASRPNAIGRNDYVYKAQVGVNAARTGSTAASMIKYGLAGAAIYGIVEGVGWIIENGVVVKPKPSGDKLPNYQYAWFKANAYDVPFTSSLAVWEHYKTPSQTLVKTLVISNDVIFYYYSSSGYIYAHYKINKYYDPNYQPDYEPVSDTELGEAIQNSPSAPQVIPDIYSPNNPVPRPSPAPDAVETALENANPEPRNPTTSDTEKKPNTDTDGDGVADTYDPAQPDAGETTTWPLACEWFPAACEFFKVQKKDNKEIKENQEKQLEQDKSFFEKVEEWFDWSKDESGETDDTDTPEINQIDIGTLDTSTFQATAGCPAPIEVPVNIGSGGNVEISYEPICQFAEKWSFVAPLIGFLSGAMILVGVGRKGEDGEL